MNRFVSRRRAVAVLAGAATAAAARPSSAEPEPAIRFGGSPTADSYMLPYYAQEMGFFKRAGLNVEIAGFASAGPIATAMAGGAVDVGQIDPVVVANAFNRGVPWALFAGGGTYNTDAATTVLVSLPGATVKTGKDLEGKSVGVVALASLSALGVRAWIESTGGDLAKIKLFELSYATMVPAMLRGDIVAGFVAEPFYSSMKKDIRIVANAFDAIARQFFISATFATKAYIDKNPTLVRRLAGVLDDTVRWANTHQDDSAVVAAKMSGLALETVRAMTRVRYAELDARLVQPVLDASYKYKAIEKPVNAADIIVRA